MDDANNPPQDDGLRGMFPRSYEAMVAHRRARTAAAPGAPTSPASGSPAAASSTSSPAPSDRDANIRGLFPRSGDRMLREGGRTGDAPVPATAAAPNPSTAPAAESSPATPGAPLELDGAAAGFKADDPVFGDFKKLAGELGLDKEKAGKILELQKRARDAETQVYVDELKGWEQKTRADKEIGGAAINESVGLARGVLQKYGTPELVKELDAWGFGNHPEMIRLLVRVGRELGKRVA